MPNSRQDRLTDTLNYIDNIPDISPAHFSQMRLAKKNDLAASDQISLGSRPSSTSKNPMETQRRRALRALLLCLHWAGFASQIKAAKLVFQNSAEGDIRDAISSFFPLASGSTRTVIAKARTYQPTMGDYDLNSIYQYRRAAVIAAQSVMGGNCYAAVTIWMYLGGAVSLRWLKKYGSQPALQLPEYVIWGPPIRTPADAAVIEEGQICRIEKRGPGGGGLHYVLTVARGICVGVNNSGDICLNWIAGYGNAPMPTYSEFQIAGYLATMQSDDHYRESEIRTAPCLPLLGMTF